MTAALLDRPGTLFTDAAERPGGERPAEGEQPGGQEPALPGGRATLEDLLSATLHAARANGSAECPVCHARMTSAGADAACASCGSRLS